MAYSVTLDERYAGGFQSAPAGYRDAPASLATLYTLAEGLANQAYGTLNNANFLADLDVYALGVLGPGRYSFTATGWNWDFTNSVFGLGLSRVVVYDSLGFVVASSYAGLVDLTVNTSGTYYLGVEGSGYTSTEYALYYQYMGPAAPVNAPAVFSGGFTGTLQAGQTLTMDVTAVDANGTLAAQAGAGLLFTWEVSSDGTTWSPVSNVTTRSIVIGSADVGKFVRGTMKFLDDAGFLESYSLTTVNRVAAPANRAPVGSNANVAVNEDSSFTGSLPVASDPEGDAFTYLVGAAPVNGTASITAAGVLSYTPKTNFFGVDQLQYTVRDAKGAAASYTVTINVAAQNDVPTVSGGKVEGDEDQQQSGNLPVAADVDGDALTYSLANAPTGGTATIEANGRFTYTPKANESGTDQLTFRVSDSKGGSALQTLDLAIRSVKDEFAGSPGADVMAGFAGPDVYRAGAGNDVITGGGGNDEIDGEGGVDQAKYAGARSSFTVARSGESWVVTDKSGAEGIDTLVRIERLYFKDTALALDLDGNAGAVAQVVRALFGAESLQSPEYIGYGLQAMDGGMSQSDLVAFAIAATGMSAMSSEAFVRTVYRNVVGADPDAVSLAEFAAALETGAHTKASLGLLAAQVPFNTNSVELIGLHDSGLEFVWPAG